MVYVYMRGIKKIKKMKFTLLIAFITAFNFIYSQTTGNIVTLTTSGTGKTIEEAKNNALRSAIEQAFGAFISSKTEILNDEIVKDEIVSLSGGSILNYEIITETNISSGLYSTSLKATVSLRGLQTYCENKGIEIEFKGQLFATNLKVQELNEAAEFQSIRHLIEMSNELLKKSIDYEIKISDPVAVNNSELFRIKYEISCLPNNNIYVFNKYFIESILGISMDENEKSEYLKLNKKIYTVKLFYAYEGNGSENSKSKKNKQNIVSGYETICLRSIQSIIALQNFLISCNQFVLNFKISNDIETISPLPLPPNQNMYLRVGTVARELENGWILNVNESELANSINLALEDEKQGLIDFKYLNGLKQTSWGYFYHFIQDYTILEKMNLMNYVVQYRPRMGDRYINPSQNNELYPPDGIGTIKIVKVNKITHLYFAYYNKEQLGKISYVKVVPSND
jgi:hypothetical protein